MHKVVFLADETATIALGHALAQVVKTGDVIALKGELGAGKTCLARGLIQALSNTSEPMEVPSPTFTLVQTYDFEALTVWHFDLYRLERAAEIWELGFEDALNEGLVLIEWPERALELLPEDRLTLELTIREPGREVSFTGGKNWEDRLEHLG